MRGILLPRDKKKGWGKKGIKQGVEKRGKRGKRDERDEMEGMGGIGGYTLYTRTGHMSGTLFVVH